MRASNIESSQKQRKPRLSFKFRLGNWQDWLGLCLLFVTLEIAVSSIEQAHWVNPQPSLTLVLVFAVLAGFLLANRLPAVVTYFLAVVVGAGVTIWQASILLSPSKTGSAVSQLLATLTTTGPSDGTIHFSTFLIIFTWMAGFVSTWFFLRKQNTWVAVTLGALIVLVNLSNLPDNFYWFFFLYLLASLLLIAGTNVIKQYSSAKKVSQGFPKRGVMYTMASAFGLGLLLVFIVWNIPEIRISKLETIVASETTWTKNIQKHVTDFVAAVPRKQPFFKSDEESLLWLGGYFGGDTNVQFVVNSEQARYWRARVYDLYTSSGWMNSNGFDQELEPTFAGTEAEGLNNFSEMTYTVVPKLRTDVVLTTGEFISSDVPVLAKFLSSPSLADAIVLVTSYPLKPDQQYKVTASLASATEANLFAASSNYPQSVTDHYLQLPSSLSERVRQLSKLITRDAVSPYGKALAIKAYLSRYHYTLETSPLPKETDGVDYFLFTQSSGNCLYFASAMVVMLRSVGVPSRLCTGYLSNERERPGGDFILRGTNYHAWPEIYFPGNGWVDIESTPQSGEAGGGGEDDIGLDQIGETPNVGVVPHEGMLLLPLTITGIALLVVALALASIRWLEHFAGLDYAYTVYGRMCTLASLAKLGPKPQQTPLEYRARLASVFPSQAQSLDDIVHAYVKARFSSVKQLAPSQRQKLHQSWRKVYPSILKHLFFRKRKSSSGLLR